MIQSRILRFYQQLESDKNHRYMSWEHCFKYFSQTNPNEEMACLYLAFYLASWGMYRGSSFLLWKDYLVHREVVKRLLSSTHLRSVDFSQECSAEIDQIFEWSDWIRNWYEEHIREVNGKSRKIHVTDTLTTKILLGTLGCIPAYDRYFIGGLRAEKLSYSRISKPHFRSLVEFYKHNKGDFDSAQVEIKKKSGVYYPAMKLVDMYFWQIGFEKSA